MSSPLPPGQDLAPLLFSDLAQSFPSLLYRGQGQLSSCTGVNQFLCSFPCRDQGSAFLCRSQGQLLCSLLCRDQESDILCRNQGHPPFLCRDQNQLPSCTEVRSAPLLPPGEGSWSVPFLGKRLGSVPHLCRVRVSSPLPQFLHRDGSTMHMHSAKEFCDIPLCRRK